MAATIVQLAVEGFPELRIEELEDAKELTAILARNGVAVNLRGASA